MSEEEKLKLKRYLLLVEAEKHDNMQELIDEEYEKAIKDEDENDESRRKV